MKLYYILLLFLIGCGHTQEQGDNLVFVPTLVNCEDFGRIEPIKTLPVVFVSGTDRRGYEILGLRGDQYSNLAINSSETLRYIVEQKKESSYYKKCIEDHNSNAQKERGPD